MDNKKALTEPLPMLVGIVKSIPGTAASAAETAKQGAQEAQAAAEAAAEIAQQHAWGVSVSDNTLSFAEPENP